MPSIIHTHRNSQCGIPPGESMVYNFTVSLYNAGRAPSHPAHTIFVAVRRLDR